MIKKLRIKLIAASMASLFLVLFIIGGIVGILNYRKVVVDADQILSIMEENAGKFPQKFSGDRKDERPGIELLGKGTKSHRKEVCAISFFLVQSLYNFFPCPFLSQSAFRRMPEASVYLTGRWDVRASVNMI